MFFLRTVTRTFKSRYSEHFRSFIYFNHNFYISYTESRALKVNLWEALQIKKIQNCGHLLNNQLDVNYCPLLSRFNIQ